MGLIKLSKHAFGHIETRRKGQSTITFKSNPVVGYVPLLKLFNVITGSNDYFSAKSETSISTTVRNIIDFRSGYKKFSFQKIMRSRRSFNNPQRHIVISLLSVLGMQNKVEEVISQGVMRNHSLFTRNKKQNVLITNSIDVFVLAMIKPSDIGKIVINEHNIEFDSSLITLYVSKEKYYDKTFLDNTYNSTVAKYLRQEINSFSKREGVKIEVVPDSILKLYYTNPHSVKTSSIFEIMEIDNQVKEKVFSNLSESLMKE